MNIDEILDSVVVEIEKTAKSTEKKEDVDISSNSIEKLAMYLETYSEEDTLLDDIAKLAVLNDKVTLAVLAKKVKDRGAKND